MVEQEDFYMENGWMVFTAAHHLKRGYCCKNKCRHCPWNYGKSKDNKVSEKDSKIED